MLGGQEIPNHRIVTVDEIGEGLNALFCFTNEESCCDAGSGGVRGRWLSPDGTVVGVSGDVYESRGPSTLSLNIARAPAVGTGLFRCEIPNRAGENITTYTGVYPDVPNAGTCLI